MSKSKARLRQRRSMQADDDGRSVNQNDLDNTDKAMIKMMRLLLHVRLWHSIEDAMRSLSYYRHIAMLLHTRVVFVHGTPGQTSLGTIFANQSVTLEVYFRAGKLLWWGERYSALLATLPDLCNLFFQSSDFQAGKKKVETKRHWLQMLTCYPGSSPQPHKVTMMDRLQYQQTTRREHILL